MTRSTVRLHCRALEDRATPAVGVSLTSGGNLILTGDNTNNVVVITVNAGNMMDVEVNGAPAGTFHPTAGIFAYMGTGDDTVHIDLNGNTAALTNVVLRGGDGLDELTIQSGTLQASVWMLGGNGDDKLTIGGATVTGAAVVLNGGAGVDEGQIGGATINANTWVSGAQSNKFGGTDFNGNVVVVPGESTPAFAGFDGGDIPGSVYYFGSSSDDVVDFGGGAKVVGNLIVSLGNGNNSLVVHPGATLGRTRVWAGSGNDSVNFGSTASAKSTDIILGNGTNTVTFSGAIITGSLRVWGGHGNDTMTMNAHDSVSGSIALYMGNGTNSFTGVQNVGGSFTYIGGNGVDTVDLSSARTTSYAVRLRLGDGDDTFTYTHITGNLDPLSFNLNFGGGADTFNISVPITWPSIVVGL